MYLWDIIQLCCGIIKASVQTHYLILIMKTFKIYSVISKYTMHYYILQPMFCVIGHPAYSSCLNQMSKTLLTSLPPTSTISSVSLKCYSIVLPRVSLCKSVLQVKS